MELTRLAILYVHLMACCVAIGLVFTQDLAMLSQLLRGCAVQYDTHRFRGLHRTLTASLAILWLTGATLVGMVAWSHGAATLLNPKLQAKITIVVLLTLNGVALKRWLLPAMESAGSLLDLRPGARALAAFVGAVSGVSWLYAAMLGLGRALDWQYPLSTLLGAYVPLVLAGTLAMMAVLAWADHRRRALCRMFDDFVRGCREGAA